MERESNRNPKETKVTLIISIIIMLTVVIGLTYAYFSARDESAPQTITTANLGIQFGDGTAIVNALNITPIEESEILTKAAKKSFTVSRRAGVEGTVYTRIDITNIVIDDELVVYDFKWALFEGLIPITTGSFASMSDDKSINLTTNIPLTTSRTYNLYIWIQETGEEQNSMMNKEFIGTITISGEASPLDTLASKILSETPQTNPSFTTTSTDTGLYVQQNDSEKSEYGFPTHYYRGAVINNYVQFGTYATSGSYIYYDNNWEQQTKNYTAGDSILWRIVRINEDGSIRLISENNNISNGFFSNNNNSKYEGSTIEGVINSWYNTHIGNNQPLNNKVVKGNFCNDISGINFETGLLGNASTRIYTNKKPIYRCPQGGAIINAKAGLISGDEILYAGGYPGQAITGNTTYLNNNTFFWTITPNIADSANYWNPNYVFLGSDFVNNGESSPRPVINLKSDVTVSGGTGTSTDPYVIK